MPAPQATELPYVYFPVSESVDPTEEVVTTAEDEKHKSVESNEGNPIMTPDERAWNKCMIKSFFGKRYVVDAIVLTSTGIVINTLTRQLKVRYKTMYPGAALSWCIISLMIIKILFMLSSIGSGIYVARVVNAFNDTLVVTKHLNMSKDESFRLFGSSTLVLSLYLVKSRITFYNHINESIFSRKWMSEASLQRYWLQLRNRLERTITNLLMGERTLITKLNSRRGRSSRSTNEPRLMTRSAPLPQPMPVPHCYQEHYSLRIAWHSMFYNMVLYILILIAQAAFYSKTILFQSISHLENKKDQALTPEQMKTRVTIGLAGVVGLQRVCFFTKLALLIDACQIIIFLRWIVSIKEAKYLMLQLTKELQEAQYPVIVVRYASGLVYIVSLLGLANCVTFLSLQMLTRFYSRITLSKVPHVKITVSQDESYVA